jgi:hypothetical protein
MVVQGVSKMHGQIKQRVFHIKTEKKGSYISGNEWFLSLTERLLSTLNTTTSTAQYFTHN